MPKLAIPVVAMSVAMLVSVPLQARADSGSGGGDASGATGTSVQADFNGDTFADLAVGVPNETVGAVSEAGAVNVIYGSASGLSAKIVPDQLWHQASTNVEGTAEQGDHFGTAVAAGDFNGDGFGDLAVGVPSEDIGSVAAAGAVNVIYGSPSGLSATATPDQLWFQDSPNIEDSSEVNDFFGIALTAADFGGGAQADLAVGVRAESVGSVTDAGAVNVIYGSAIGLAATATPDQLWHQNTSNVADTAEAGDWFGHTLAAADFGGTTQADLAVGAPFENVGSVRDAGAVNVIYGSPSGLSATATPDQLWHQDSPDVEDAAQERNFFGYALAAADFGGGAKGRADLAVGVPEEDVGAVQAAGAVNVIYGSSSGLSATATPDQLWHQNSANVEEAAEEYDRFAHALAAADLGGTAQADLAVGVRHENVGSVTDAGAVNVIYGSPSGLSATATPDQLWHQNTPNVEDAAEAQDFFGNVLVAADFGGGTQADLAVGVTFEDVGSVTSAGAVNVIYGSASGLSATATPDQLWHQDTPNVEDAAGPGDWFGSALTAIR